MRLQVVTPQGSKIDETASQVTAPGELGHLGILPGHRPLLTSLGIGVLEYAGEGGSGYLTINEGYMQVANDVVTLVTEASEWPEEIDVERAREAQKRAERELDAIDEERPEERARAKARRERADNRLEAARLAKHERPSAP